MVSTKQFEIVLVCPHLGDGGAQRVLAQWTAGWVTLCRRPRTWRCWWKTDLRDQQILIQAAKVMLIACYVTSAATKIERSQGRWMWDTPNLAVHIVKTHHDAIYSQGGDLSPVAEIAPRLMTEHPNLTRLVVGLALRGRRSALVVGTALLSMHIGNSLLMRLDFLPWAILLVVFLINAPFWFLTLGHRICGHASEHPAPALKLEVGK